MNPEIAKPLAKLLIQGGIIVGATVCATAITPAAGMATLMATLLSSGTKTFEGAAGSILANILEGGKDYICNKIGQESHLGNEPLTRVIGKAIAEIVRSQVKTKSFRLRDRGLIKLANYISQDWSKALEKYSQQQISGINSRDLGIREIDLPKYFLGDPSQFDQLRALTEPTWREILRSVAKFGKIQVSESSISRCAAELHLKFPNALRESLKQERQEAFTELSRLVWGKLYQAIESNQAAIVQEIYTLQKTDCNILGQLELISSDLKQSIDQCDRLEETQRQFLNEFVRIIVDFEELKAIASRNLKVTENVAEDVKGIKADVEKTRKMLEKLSASKDSDRPLPPSSIVSCLVTLDYREQHRRFEDTIDKYDCASFVIRGGYGCGQRWLINRFLHGTPFGSSAFRQPLHVNRCVRQLEDFWYTIGHTLKTIPKPEAIQENLFNRWQTQTVVLAVYGLENFRKYLPAFLSEVWQPLIAKMREYTNKNRYRLLIFWVDDSGKAFELEIPQMSDRLCIPIELPPLSSIPNEQIESWFGIYHQLFEQQMQGSDMDRMLEEILEANDYPIRVLQKICAYADVEWEDIVTRFVL